jgi:transposase
MMPAPVSITVEQWTALSQEARALIESLMAIHEADRVAWQAERASWQAERTNLHVRIAKLEADLAARDKTPRNSSLPPASEHPHAKPPRAKRRSKKKRGGQHGHPKAMRALIPTTECQQVEVLKPHACRGCGSPLAGEDPAPLRHQVWELPEIKPLVREYQLHRLFCPSCRTSTCARLPAGVPHGQAGPRLVAWVALLMGCFRQSKRRVAFFLEQLLGQPCSPAWVVKLQKQATSALRPAYEEVAFELPKQSHLGIDETATKEANAKGWLWTFVATSFTFFAVRTSRAAEVLKERLGDSFAGVVTCDRAKMYYTLKRLQWCWAHLKRDFQALIDSPDPQVKRLGHDLMRPTVELFRIWRRYREGTITRRGLKRRMAPVRIKVDNLLLRGACSGNPALVGMCNDLYKHRSFLWTFLDVDGVEPTNNASERALRPAVIWRKLSFGTQSEGGSRFVETMLTVVETCRQQSRNLIDFVTTAVQAHIAQQTAPSLLTGV